jgi:plastocyanin
MIWLRAAMVAVLIGLIVLAVNQRTAQTALQTAAAVPLATPSRVDPTPLPTRVPLPTAPPQMIISRVARETPPPRPTSTPQAAPGVAIVDNGYLPGQLTVQVGAVVSWVNTGSDGHDVSGTGPGGAWRSGPLAPAERYQRPFDLPGIYDYVCTIHPEMRGRIVVQP